ncbi:hypothetical protein HK102_004278, partial [Quaeritorhiza haematococci]
MAPSSTSSPTRTYVILPTDHELAQPPHQHALHQTSLSTISPTAQTSFDPDVTSFDVLSPTNHQNAAATTTLATRTFDHASILTPAPPPRAISDTTTTRLSLVFGSADFVQDLFLMGEGLETIDMEAPPPRALRDIDDVTDSGSHERLEKWLAENGGVGGLERRRSRVEGSRAVAENGASWNVVGSQGISNSEQRIRGEDGGRSGVGSANALSSPMSMRPVDIFEGGTTSGGVEWVPTQSQTIPPVANRSEQMPIREVPRSGERTASDQARGMGVEGGGLGGLERSWSEGPRQPPDQQPPRTQQLQQKEHLPQTPSSQPALTPQQTKQQPQQKPRRTASPSPSSIPRAVSALKRMNLKGTVTGSPDRADPAAAVGIKGSAGSAGMISASRSGASGLGQRSRSVPRVEKVAEKGREEDPVETGVDRSGVRGARSLSRSFLRQEREKGEERDEDVIEVGMAGRIAVSRSRSLSRIEKEKEKPKEQDVKVMGAPQRGGSTKSFLPTASGSRPKSVNASSANIVHTTSFANGAPQTQKRRSLVDTVNELLKQAQANVPVTASITKQKKLTNNATTNDSKTNEEQRASESLVKPGPPQRAVSSGSGVVAQEQAEERGRQRDAKKQNTTSRGNDEGGNVKGVGGVKVPAQRVRGRGKDKGTVHVSQDVFVHGTEEAMETSGVASVSGSSFGGFSLPGMTTEEAHLNVAILNENVSLRNDLAMAKECLSKFVGLISHVDGESKEGGVQGRISSLVENIEKDWIGSAALSNELYQTSKALLIEIKTLFRSIRWEHIGPKQSQKEIRQRADDDDDKDAKINALVQSNVKLEHALQKERAKHAALKDSHNRLSSNLATLEKAHATLSERAEGAMRSERTWREIAAEHKEAAQEQLRKVVGLETNVEFYKNQVQVLTEEQRQYKEVQGVVNDANKRNIAHLKGIIEKSLGKIPELIDVRKLKHSSSNASLETTTTNASTTTATTSSGMTASGTSSSLSSSGEHGAAGGLAMADAVEAETRMHKDRYEVDSLVMSKRIEHLERQNRSLQTQLDKALKIKTAEEEWCALMTKHRVAEDQVKALKESLAQKTRVVDLVQERLFNLNNDCGILKSEIQRQKGAYARVKVDLANKDAKLKDLEKKCKELIETNTALEVKTKNLTSNHSQKDNLAKDLRSKLETTQIELEQLRGMVDRTEALREALRKCKDEIARKESQTAMWKKRVEEMTEELESLKSTRTKQVPADKLNAANNRFQQCESKLTEAESRLREVVHQRSQVERALDRFMDAVFWEMGKRERKRRMRDVEARAGARSPGWMSPRSEGRMKQEQQQCGECGSPKGAGSKATGALRTISVSPNGSPTTVIDSAVIDPLDPKVRKMVIEKAQEISRNILNIDLKDLMAEAGPREEDIVAQQEEGRRKLHEIFAEGMPAAQRDVADLAEESVVGASCEGGWQAFVERGWRYPTSFGGNGWEVGAE